MKLNITAGGMRMKNKIIVCISENADTRADIIASVLIRSGFALIKSDAKKITKHVIQDVDISEAYFIAVASYSFTASNETNVRLVQMAARGNLVVVGAKRVPKELEPFVEIVYK